MTDRIAEEDLAEYIGKRVLDDADKQTPPGWVLIEAAKRCGWPERNLASVWDLKQFDPPFRALCDMIERYEQPPVDRKLLCAEQAFGKHDIPGQMKCIRAIELWEEGFGK